MIIDSLLSGERGLVEMRTDVRYVNIAQLLAVYERSRGT